MNRPQCSITTITVTICLLSCAALAQTSSQRPSSEIGANQFAALNDRPGTNPAAAGATGKPSVRRTFSRSIGAHSGEVVLWQPARAKDLAARFVNTGSSEITVILRPEPGAGSPTTLSLKPRSSGMPGAIRGVAKATSISAICNASGTQACTLDLDLKFAAPGGGVGDDIKDGFWFASNDYHGSISDPTDSTRDCLWNFDTLWESVTARDMDVFFEATGPHDVEVLIWEGAISNKLDVNGLDAGIVHTNGGDYYDVVKVETRCTRSPVSACSPCNFDYYLTVAD